MAKLEISTVVLLLAALFEIEVPFIKTNNFV